jgi:hypothetical protein
MDPSGEDYFDCLAKCIEKNDPIEMLTAKVIGTLCGMSLPKSWVASLAESLGDTQLAKAIRLSARSGSKYTTMPSTLQGLLRSKGGTAGLRVLGRIANVAFLAYGTYMATVEVQCAAYCVCLDKYHPTPGIPVNPGKWIEEQAAIIISNIANDSSELDPVTTTPLPPEKFPIDSNKATKDILKGNFDPNESFKDFIIRTQYSSEKI